MTQKEITGNALTKPRAHAMVAFGALRHAAPTLQVASKIFTAFTTTHDLGASESPDCFVVDGQGKIIAQISYNGRVWKPESDAAIQPVRMRYTESRPYKDKDGKEGVYKLELIVEFKGVCWDVVEVVSASGKPSFDTSDPADLSGGVSSHIYGNARMMASAGFTPLEG